MHTTFEPERAAPPRSTAMRVWLLCAVILLGPSILVWIVRGTALAFSCAPGTSICHGMPLGNGMRDTLTLAWFIGTNTFVALMVGLAASIAALFARKPLLAGVSVLFLPLAALVLPTFAVFFSTYDGCQVNEAGVGDCLLWGTNMGMSFHQAAMAPWLIYGIVPYSFAIALMIGAIGFMFCRARNDQE